MVLCVECSKHHFGKKCGVVSHHTFFQNGVSKESVVWTELGKGWPLCATIQVLV